MAIFKLDWLNPDGSVKATEVVNQADRDTVDGYIDCRFGASYDKKKAKVTLIEDAKTEVVAEKPTAKSTKKK